MPILVQLDPPYHPNHASCCNHTSELASTSSSYALYVQIHQSLPTHHNLYLLHHNLYLSFVYIYPRFDKIHHNSVNANPSKSIHIQKPPLCCRLLRCSSG
ncbi:hypothetical protein QVD17_04135 [Tagetes erecta]|uniref:Uncharacterized protein n=1 Tax=Tagetes erecta TaxID=13708 RepID=A0AAD8LC93_TARER|nr:hypothetical protein QVD17_04135 [Tagetes erecta]